jgi:hypothetical protein
MSRRCHSLVTAQPAQPVLPTSTFDPSVDTANPLSKLSVQDWVVAFGLADGLAECSA